MVQVEAEPDPARRHQQVALLKQVKAALEDQVHRLNQDAGQVRV